MKKKIVIIVSVIVLFVLLIFNFSTVIFIGNENVTAKYIYSDKNIITWGRQEFFDTLKGAA